MLIRLCSPGSRICVPYTSIARNDEEQTQGRGDGTQSAQEEKRSFDEVLVMSSNFYFLGLINTSTGDSEVLMTRFTIKMLR